MPCARRSAGILSSNASGPLEGDEGVGVGERGEAEGDDDVQEEERRIATSALEVEVEGE